MNIGDVVANKFGDKPYTKEEILNTLAQHEMLGKTPLGKLFAKYDFFLSKQGVLPCNPPEDYRPKYGYESWFVHLEEQETGKYKAKRLLSSIS
jgi:hypothetical protein